MLNGFINIDDSSFFAIYEWRYDEQLSFQYIFSFNRNENWKLPDDNMLLFFFHFCCAASRLLIY